MGKSVEFSFGVVATQTRKIASIERLGMIARDILDFLNSQIRPNQFEVWFNQTWFAESHNYSRSAVNRAVKALRTKGFVTPTGLIQYPGRGRYTLVYDVTRAREEFEAGGYKQDPDKLIRNWSKAKVAKRTRGGRYVPYKARAQNEKPEQPSLWRQATGTRERAPNGQFISSLGTREPAFTPILPDSDQRQGEASTPHPRCAPNATQPIVSFYLNSPPTPSVESHSVELSPENLEEEGFEVLWNALRPHADFTKWKRSPHFEKILRPIIDEKGFEEGFNLLLNALTGAAIDNWWGGRETKAKDFVHNWKRWLPGVVKSTHLERFIEEGAAHLDGLSRRKNALREQRKRDEEQKQILQMSKHDVEENLAIFHNELKKVEASKRADADHQRKRRSASNKKHLSQMPIDDVTNRDSPLAEARAALKKMNSTEQEALRTSRMGSKVYSEQRRPRAPDVPDCASEGVSESGFDVVRAELADCARKRASDREGFHNTPYRA